MNKKASAINAIWFFLITFSVVAASWTGKMAEVTKAGFDGAKSAVTLAIGLIGAMALWLGIMKVAEKAGLLNVVAKLIRPIMVRLFPEIPSNHPAVSAMVMNIAANMLGLGNAATPMGIKAMQELNTLNKDKETATNSMALFLAINTSGVALLPLGVIAVRSAAGAKDAASIFIPSLLATMISTLVAIIICKLFEKRSKQKHFIEKQVEPLQDLSEPNEEPVRYSFFSRILFILSIVAIFTGLLREIVTTGISMQFFSDWAVPLLMLLFLGVGFTKGVKVYEVLTDGAKQGFDVALRIIPFLVAIFAAISMFRASGAMDILIKILSPVTNLIGMPAEALSMALIRPLSGSGAFAVMSEVVNKDPDSFLSYLVSTMMGSTETTFYVMAVYFGAVGIKKVRHALIAGLSADVAGALASIFLCKLFF